MVYLTGMQEFSRYIWKTSQGAENVSKVCRYCRQKQESPVWTLEAYRPQHNKYSICCPVPTLDRGLPTLARGYLPWLGVPTLDGGYLPWGILPLCVPTGGYLPWGTWGLDLAGVPPPLRVNRLKTLPSPILRMRSVITCTHLFFVFTFP